MLPGPKAAIRKLQMISFSVPEKRNAHKSVPSGEGLCHPLR